MRKIKTALVIACVVPFLAGTGYGEIRDAGEYLNKNVVERKLKNGITVIMLNRGYTPTLAFEISFRVGSSDENYRTAGAAHLLEHMLFKGTDRLGTVDFEKEKVILDRIEAVGETLDRLRLVNPGNMMIPGLEKELKELQARHSPLVVNSPYDKLYSENGGVGFNASTSRDSTGYYIELPASKLDLWARIESERLRNPIFREYYLERNNVIQERLMRYESSGTGLLFEQFLSQAFSAHPYRHPTIGWESNIPFLSIRDVRNFYRTYYTPSRMTITIVGSQDVEKTFGVVEKYFGSMESRPDPPSITIAEPPQRGEKRFTVTFESSPYIIMGWHKPTYPQVDDYTFDVISEILTGGDSSRLYRTLVLDKQLATSVESWNGAPGSRYDNLFIIYAAPKNGTAPQDMEKAVYEVLEDMMKNVTEDEIQKAVNKMESQMVFGLSSSKQISGLLSHYQTVFNDWHYVSSYLENIKKTNIKDIRTVMRKYIKAENRIVGILEDSRKEKKQ
jgi:predicted Zn-dependent peptidase